MTERQPVKLHRGIAIMMHSSGYLYANIRLGPGGKKEKITGLSCEDVARQIDRIARSLGA